MEGEVEIDSNVYMAALNGALILLTYFFVVVFAVLLVKYAYGIDIIAILEGAFAGPIPFSEEVFKFLEFLVEHVIITTIVLAGVYAAYIANYKVEVEDEMLKYQKGFLFLETQEFEIEDVEQVFTQDYPFFKDTKELCVKALDSELLKIPYVRNADKTKQKIIRIVKERRKDLDMEEFLEAPIKVMNWNPAEA